MNKYSLDDIEKRFEAKIQDFQVNKLKLKGFSKK